MYKNGKINTYIFDLGGVINSHNNDFLYNRLLTKCDDRLSKNILEKMFCHEDYATGQLSVISFYENIKSNFGYTGDWREFSEDWCCHLSLCDGMIDFIKNIQKGSRVILLSNTNLLHWTKLLELSEFELANFEAFLSFDMGLAKPSHTIFKKVITDASIKPESTLFIDDLHANVVAAEACGFKVYLYDNREGLERYLS